MSRITRRGLLARLSDEVDEAGVECPHCGLTDANYAALSDEGWSHGKYANGDHFWAIRLDRFTLGAVTRKQPLGLLPVKWFCTTNPAAADGLQHIDADVDHHVSGQAKTLFTALHEAHRTWCRWLDADAHRAARAERALGRTYLPPSPDFTPPF